MAVHDKLKGAADLKGAGAVVMADGTRETVFINRQGDGCQIRVERAAPGTPPPVAGEPTLAACVRRLAGASKADLSVALPVPAEAERYVAGCAISARGGTDFGYDLLTAAPTGAAAKLLGIAMAFVAARRLRAPTDAELSRVASILVDDSAAFRGMPVIGDLRALLRSTASHA